VKSIKADRLVRNTSVRKSENFRSYVIDGFRGLGSAAVKHALNKGGAIILFASGDPAWYALLDISLSSVRRA
jgi:hypothetical protein